MNLPQPSKDLAITKACARFSPIKAPVDDKTAIIYVRLRSDGCDRKAAKRFVCRPICRSDNTREKDGPTRCRTLICQKSPKEFLENGWKIFDPVYNLGNGLHLSKNEIIINGYEDLLFQNHFHKQELKIKEDYKRKISQISNYFEEINQSNKLSGLDNRELMAKLEQARDKVKVSRKLKNLNSLQFHTPNVTLKHMDKELLEELNIGTSSDLGLQSKILNGSESPRKSLSAAESPRRSISETAMAQSPSLRLASVNKIKEEEASSIILHDSSHNAKVTENHPSTKGLMETLCSENSPRERTRSLAREMHNQVKSLSRVLDRDTGGNSIGFKLSGGGGKPRRKTTESHKTTDQRARRDSAMYNFATNRLLVREFNRVNYVFGNDADGLSPDTSPAKKSRSTALLAKQKTSHKKNSSDLAQHHQKEYEQYDLWKKKPIQEINNIALERKRQEMELVLKKYQTKLKPLETSDPKTRQARPRTVKNSPRVRVHSSSTEVPRSCSNQATRPSTNYFPSKRSTTIQENSIIGY